jgi:hypothetical protein
VFQNVIQSVAPDLWMTLQSGALGQAGSVAQSILSNPTRLATIQNALSSQLGGASANVSDLMSNLVKSTAPATAAIAPAAPAQAASNLLNSANDVISNTSNSGAQIHEGAIPIHLVIQGNADSVTAAQLQGHLQGFADELCRQLVART